MTEIEFERAVVDLAHMFDWKVASFRPAGTGKGWRTPVKYDGKGYPDLTMVHPTGFVIFAEMKADKGTLSAEQKAWQNTMKTAERRIYDFTESAGLRPRVAHYVWRPKDAKSIALLLSFGRVSEWAL